ncbi:MAG: D-alanyl-D-alanine carboxypeptidase [Cyanobacteria bacterium J06639_1]
MATQWKPIHTFGAIALLALVSTALKHELLQRRTVITFRRESLEVPTKHGLTFSKDGKSSPPAKLSPSVWCGVRGHYAAAPIPTPPPPLPSPTPTPAVRSNPDRALEVVLQAVADIRALGLDASEQSFLVMNERGQAIASHNSSMKLSASLPEELASTLAHLEMRSPQHRFVTRIYTTGGIEGGVLQGHVWVQSSLPADLLWESSPDIAARLRERGIHTIAGNLAAIGSTALYFNPLPLQPLEGITMRGAVGVDTDIPDRASLLFSYPSQPLLASLKARNTFGRNAAVEILASASRSEPRVFATAQRVQRTSSNAVLKTAPSALATSHIRVGGSTYRRFSTLATATLLHELQQRIPDLSSLLPTVGLDVDTLGDRDLPFGTAIKTDTTSDVVAIAGVLPDGTIFAAFNQGNDPEALRTVQDRFVRNLAQRSTPQP